MMFNVLFFWLIVNLINIRCVSEKLLLGKN